MDAADLDAARYDAELHAELRRLRAAVARHRPCRAADEVLICNEDGFTWPCPTARAAGVEA
jgi:hypothetical protein